jgi:WD40 repeat protein
MIDLFSVNPPWNIHPCHRFVAHDASIVDITYLSKVQLVVTSSMDQTIKLWDPVAKTHSLTVPANNPHAQQRPGYYKPIKTETTKTNMPYNLVQTIYTAADTVCFALKAMKIDNLVLNSKVPEVKNVLEWLISLKLAKLSPLLGDQSK